jgi:hypothetical protein
MVHPTDPLYPTWLKIVQKHKKFNLIRKQDYSKGGDSAGNSLAIGNPGYGKTTGNRREVELRWALGHKIFCLYDGGQRLDMAYFMFPSVSDFWKVPKLKVSRNGRKSIIAARKYPTEILIPVTKEIPKRLPNCFVPFSIAVSDLTQDDLIAILGERYGDTIKAAYSYMEEKVDDETTPLDYIRFLEEAWKKGDEEGTKLSFSGPKKLIEAAFRPLMQQGLLTSKRVSSVLDIQEKIKDKKTISVLCLRHCPKSLHGFLVYYFISHVYSALSGVGTTKMMKTKVSIVLNEVADLLSKDSEQGTSSWSIAQMIGRIAKQYRTASLYLLMDTQLPQELPEIKETMKRVYVYNSSLPSVERAMTIAGISTYAGDINQDDFSVIPRLSPGEYYLFDRDNGVSVHKLMWLRSRTYIAGEDFYDIYDKYYGKTAYQNITPILEEIKAEREKSEENWAYRKALMEPEKKKKRKRKSEDDEEDEEEEELEEEIKLEGKLLNGPKRTITEEPLNEEEEVEEATPDMPNWEAYARTLNTRRVKK